MNTFTVVALGLCLALAYAEDPSASPLDLVKGVLSMEASPDVLCEPICGSSCQALKTTCFDIKGVVDCAAKVAKCASRCNQLCGCLHECPRSCAEDCSSSSNFLERTFCNGRVQVCTNLCTNKCPIDLFTQEIMASIQKIMGALQALLSKAAMMRSAAP